MNNIDITHVTFLVALMFGVTQATLDKHGIGKVEYLPDGKILLILGVLSIPLNLLSNIGLIIITIWSFFVLDWIIALIIIGVGFILWSLILGAILANLKRSEAWESIIILGIPLQILNRLITSGCVVFLVWNYIK